MLLHGAAPLHTARVIVLAFDARISDHGLPHRYLQAPIAFALIQYVWAVQFLQVSCMPHRPQQDS